MNEAEDFVARLAERGLLVVGIESLAVALHMTEDDDDRQPELTLNDRICWGRANRMHRILTQMANKLPETAENAGETA